MRVVTNIDIPADVYIFFQKQAKQVPCKEAEDLMADYLTGYVRLMKYQEDQKQKNDSK